MNWNWGAGPVRFDSKPLSLHEHHPPFPSSLLHLYPGSRPAQWQLRSPKAKSGRQLNGHAWFIYFLQRLQQASFRFSCPPRRWCDDVMMCVKYPPRPLSPTILKMGPVMRAGNTSTADKCSKAQELLDMIYVTYCHEANDKSLTSEITLHFGAIFIPSCIVLWGSLGLSVE